MPGDVGALEIAYDMGDGVGDALEFLSDDPHAQDQATPMPKGGRIERKPYSNKDGTTRIYLVFRWEARYGDNCRYRPSEYIGKSAEGWHSKRRFVEDGLRPPCPKHDPTAHADWKAARELERTPARD